MTLTRTNGPGRAGPPRPVPGSRRGRLAPGWGLRLTAAWLGVLLLVTAVEPAPAEGAAPGFVAAVLTMALFASWLVMGVGLIGRLRLGAVASLVGAAVLMTFVIGCPVSGHHTGIGAWWWAQLAGAGALVTLSGRALTSRA